MNIYEMYGRQSEQLVEAVQFREATMALLRDLRDGKVTPARLVVEDTGWSLREVAP